MPAVAARNVEPRQERRRLPGLHGLVAQRVWVSSKVVQAILQVTNTNVTKLRRNGEIRFDPDQGGYNLADTLERYTRKLRTEGAIDSQVETICYREFDAGLIPKEVIIKHGFSFDDVKRAWQHYIEMSRDAEAARLVVARETAQKKEEATRCRTCLRTAEFAQTDALRITREVTEEPERTTTLTMAEERACVDLDLRCPTCRMLKATAPVETMKARLRIRTLRAMGPPQPSMPLSGQEAPPVPPPEAPAVAPPPAPVRPDKPCFHKSCPHAAVGTIALTNPRDAEKGPWLVCDTHLEKFRADIDRGDVRFAFLADVPAPPAASAATETAAPMAPGAS